ncbi:MULTISPECIES: Rieske 2Fe-2S domain-containing protein [unclassified Rathayibacter]|uniref:Rieske 2Fe-2S domain-containing protein n=1 Tax=unclassified Rathayibacter TaxID=2609250 RepID=UPI00104B3E3A|nr:MULTISPECIES: Rieske 2Fe-2S domain-containing protein [unclassified Rathayibacter]TCL83180.1 nitrite reductase/ring-hydroxylating ferredoxin subunit [Rathayibacter sp. PhB192]TCM28678.1 nitrite reductase/ring-hydroxylating ferredoxin subunit [Rathayibacter sp. PhB179]
MREVKLVRLVSRLENEAALDPLVDRVKKVVDAVIRPQPVRDVLHGVPIGHPVHPLLVLVPTGAWVSAAVLDLLPGNERAARTLIGLGIVSVLPTAAAGYTDWSELHEQQKRVGLVHAAANVAGTVLYTASFVQRVRGRRTSGKVLSALGLAVVSGGGYLGGHLSYRQAAGANHTEDVPHRFPTGWQTLGQLAELPQNSPVKRTVAETPLLAVRRGDRVDVLSNVCSHLSGPLDEGELRGTGADACITCPWHASAFSLETGEVVRGPATSPQPRFETRVTDGLVEVLLPHAG